jgi:hypothetical protein
LTVSFSRKTLLHGVDDDDDDDDDSSSSSNRGKGKVVSVHLTEHHAMKAYWGVEV